MKKLVIVESPTKAKTIRAFLSDEYQVEASMGHVRDLPSSAAEIPAKWKKARWARMGVNVENDFEPLYVIPDGKKKVVAHLRDLLEGADELLLATDEDREGESIGWHLLEVLKPKCPTRRMVFHEITREAITEAVGSTRDLAEDLVRAQEARRILDRLVGYTLSPLLWKKIAPRLSAGRVQSVAVRMLVERERRRQAFRTATYWGLGVVLGKRPEAPSHRFEAQLVSLAGARIAAGRDFDEDTGRLRAGADLVLLDEPQARALRERLRGAMCRVTGIEQKDAVRSPSPPFTTATLQMEANRKLGLSAAQTMRVAQRLYENGHITYMRTDSVNLSDEAINAARSRIRQLYGDEYLSETPRRFRTKSKGAQEAHEAIRPAGRQMSPPDDLDLASEEKALYDLIWKRSIATQMAEARLRFQTVTVQAGDAGFRASGRRVDFSGFLRAYVEGTDDPETALEEQESPLPSLAVDEVVDLHELTAEGHETKPPARYTEATLVKALEAEGIGRPSTYASILGTIVDRGYVLRQRKELVPTFAAFAVTTLLERHFPDLVDAGFTAGMEERLDEIASGQADWLEFLRRFYLGDHGLANQVSGKEASIDPRSIVAAEFEGGSCQVRIGRFGPFLVWTDGDQTLTASLPHNLPPSDLTAELIGQLRRQKTEGPTKLGADPATGATVYAKFGPYGPYVQLGEDSAKDGKKKEGKKDGKKDGKKQDKPKRTSLLDGMTVEEITLETALKLLGLPRSLGDHPESGKPVTAAIGRYGQYVKHEGQSTTVKAPSNVLDITLDEAVALLAAAPAKGGGPRSRKVLKELGPHAADGKPVRLLEGRYGAYVSHQRANATLPKDVSPDTLTLEEAMQLLEARKTAKKKRR